MHTNVYHTTFFNFRPSICTHFLPRNFNFRYLGCVEKISLWDINLNSGIRAKLDQLRRNPSHILLKLEEFGEILEQLPRLKLRKAILSNREPTADLAVDKASMGLGELAKVSRGC